MESQDKKQEIIKAASKIMAEKGYEKATIKDIAREAEITPGLIHYYFQNKEEILSDLLLKASHEYTHEMKTLQQSLFTDHISDSAIRKPKNKVKNQPEWYKLRYELFAIGLRNPDITGGVNTILGNGRNGIKDVLSSVFPNAKDLDTMAAILLACFDGLALQKLLDPDFDIDDAYGLLEKLALSLKDVQ